MADSQGLRRGQLHLVEAAMVTTGGAGEGPGQIAFRSNRREGVIRPDLGAYPHLQGLFPCPASLDDFLDRLLFLLGNGVIEGIRLLRGKGANPVGGTFLFLAVDFFMRSGTGRSIHRKDGWLSTWFNACHKSVSGRRRFAGRGPPPVPKRRPAAVPPVRGAASLLGRRRGPEPQAPPGPVGESPPGSRPPLAPFNVDDFDHHDREASSPDSVTSRQG